MLEKVSGKEYQKSSNLRQEKNMRGNDQQEPENTYYK